MIDKNTAYYVTSTNAEFRKKVYKQTIVACWAAIAASVVWAALDYFVRFKTLDVMALDLSMGLVAGICILLLKNKRKMYNPEIIGFGAVAYMVLSSTFLYATSDLTVFEKYSINYTAILAYAGIFYLWRIKYSLSLIVMTIVTGAVMFNNSSELGVEEFINNGGIIVCTMLIFMAVSIQMRYKLVRQDINKSISLKNSEIRANLFIDSAIDGMVTIDDRCKITMINRAAEGMFDTKSEHVVGKHFGVLLSEKYQEAMSKLGESDTIDWIEQSVNTHEIVKGSRNNSEDFPMLISISKMVINDHVYYNAFLRDITEQNNARKALIKAKNMAENAKEMQGRFLSNMSHEIRTPMNGIIGVSRLLSQTELDQEQRKYIDAIKTSADNLLVIINDILDFSKIEAGKMTIEQTDFDIRKRIDTVLDIMRPKATDKDIALRCSIEDAVPQRLVGDPTRLNQVLLNLVGNAIKFTEQGSVTIKVKMNGTLSDKQIVRVEVVDTGIGIEQDKLDSVFSSFTQASLDTTRKYGGTGLGLTISKQLIELQEGEIGVDSKENAGSTFWFEIPYGIAQEALSRGFKKVHESVPENPGLQILLVEDHEINQLLATMVLSNWGFNVELAENGQEAVDKIASKKYDLVLMDISMPIMDGYEATRQIRSMDDIYFKEIPIIAMTASALIGENQKCFNAGMNGYISKPFDPNDLLSIINKNVAQRA